LAILRLDTLFPFLEAGVRFVLLGERRRPARVLGYSPSLQGSLRRVRDAATGTGIRESPMPVLPRLRWAGSAIQVMSPMLTCGLRKEALVRGERRRETIRDRLRRVEVVTVDVGPPVGCRG
jgi:hypothetical protein